MPQVLVLCLHAVSERWNATLSVSPDDLRRRLTWLVSHGWKGARFTEAVLSPPYPRTLAVTFDDAFDSVRTLAAPILRELGLPGTVFVATDWVDGWLGWPEVARWQKSAHAHELRSMSWDALRELRADQWEIGAHTQSHAHLPQLEPETIRAELEGSRAVCERELEQPCRSLAYPFGEANERVRVAAAEAGYEAAAGLSWSAVAARTLLEWPRVGVWHDERAWRFALKASAVARNVPRGRLADVAAGVVGGWRAGRDPAVVAEVWTDSVSDNHV